MNCFHFSVSLGYNTTNGSVAHWYLQLWIAFIFQYLWDTTQHHLHQSIYWQRCELLSFFSIFEIQHNVIKKCLVLQNVVNCFHFSVSLRYNTTKIPIINTTHLLWIAFIFQYLWDTTQLNRKLNNYTVCCELLSFFSIFEIQHNSSVLLNIDHAVVNCFHFSVSLRYNTTCWMFSMYYEQLWIAFIFQYLWDTTQQMGQVPYRPLRCELLSFFSIFEIQHNRPHSRKSVVSVVNCFHFSVSLRYNTTYVQNGRIAP